MLSTVVKSILQLSAAFPTVCRVCLQQKDELQSLDFLFEFYFGVEQSAEEFSLQYLLEETLGCKVDPANTISGVCEQCLDGLIESFRFRRRCLRAEHTITQAAELLKNIVARNQTVAPFTTVLAQVSLTNPIDICFRNYVAHENNLGLLKFIDEVLDVDNILDEQKFDLSASHLNDSDQEYTSGPEGAKSSLQCNLCGKYFAYPCYLKLHMKYHGKRKHPCEVCPKSFKTSNDLKRHRKTHDANHKVKETYSCPYCNKGFVSLCGYRNHVASHEDDKNHLCVLCGRLFMSRKALHEHRKSIHDRDKKAYFCNDCGATLGSRYSLLLHLKTHNYKLEEFKQGVPCPQCGKLYRSFSLLSVHLKKHSQKRHLCTICNKLYATNNQLNRHYRHVHLRERLALLQLRCDVCGSIFTSRTSLVAHIKAHEPKEQRKHRSKKLLCPICGKLISVLGSAAYLNHLQTHGEPTYLCDVCNKKFKSKVNLYNHHKQVHVPSSEQRSYVCDHCGVVRSNKTSVMIHMRVHETKGSFKCNICDKVFVRQNYLKNHKMTHLNIRPEQCEVCGNRFINKKALLYHTRLHTGEKPYACKLCDERFVSENRRNNHFKCKHTEKSVSCKMCGALFHTQSLVNSHVKRVHLKLRSKRRNISIESGNNILGNNDGEKMEIGRNPVKCWN